MNTKVQRAAFPLRHFAYGSSKRVLIYCCLMFWLSFVIFYSFFGLASMNDLLVNQQIVNVRASIPPAQSLSEIERLGLQEMGRSSVTIVGLARNAESKLVSVLKQVEGMGALFQSSRTVFAEGDSTDNSKQILQDWTARSTSNRTLLDVGNLQDLKEPDGTPFAGKTLPREGRIGTARNALIDAMRNGVAKNNPTDFVIVVDLDILGWDFAGLAHSFGLRAKHMDWDVMCSNGILMHGVYRDTYAFRTADINTNHHTAGDDHDKYGISDAQHILNRKALERSQQDARAIMSGSVSAGRVLQVDSCFGGMAIYKYNQFNACEYGYRHQEPPFLLDCEHVIFNKCIAEKFKARIFTNPNMKLWYGHTSFNDIKSVSKVVGSVSNWVRNG